MKYKLKRQQKDIYFLKNTNKNNRSAKSWFFEKNKADRVSARFKERGLIIRNERDVP